VVRDPALRQKVAELASYAVVRWAFVAHAPLLLVLCGDGGWLKATENMWVFSTWLMKIAR
jgi:hypothetical protein